jgi:hypothetical protein
MLVMFLTALWLVGAMHCPLEALGGLANDFCCLTSPAAPDDPDGPAQSGCTYKEAARWLISRAGDTTQAPATTADAGFLPSPRPTPIPVLESTTPIAVRSPCLPGFPRVPCVPGRDRP